MTNNSKQFHQGEIMKRSFVAAVLTFVCVLGIGVSARAQDADAVVVTVPFEFVAGGATLPAGDYRVSRVTPSANRELAIRSYDKVGALLLPVAFDGVTSDKPTLSFEHVGDKYFLSDIKTEGGVYTLALPPKQIRVAHENTPSTMQISATGTK
jgi:hypothetical protein